MKADLTRFDFRALRFLKSEDVEMMTAQEVGQYVLLMCHAWLGGKEASLPNIPPLLAKYARSERVSDAVMREWKEGADGRLYNETLSEEWAAAVGRSAHGQKGAAARWNKEQSPSNAPTDAPTMPEHSPSNAPSKSAHWPNQPKPNQTKPINTPDVCEELVGFWNGNRGTLPEVLKASKSRREKITTRVKADPHFPEIFKRAVLVAIQTPFCTGAGGRGWRVDFDWLVENDKNCLAVIEGKYGPPSNCRVIEPVPVLRGDDD